MSTKCEDLPLNEPLRFLKSTVTSFNGTLGLGSQESTLNVDLVDDCDPEVKDIAGKFQPIFESNIVEVGSPVYFPDNFSVMPFSFGGVLTNWTVQQTPGGKTYNVKVSDPRQLLENTIIVIDSLIRPPVKGINYFNVYSAFEKDVLDGDCSVFGSSRSNERGMPYTKIIEKLMAIEPTICSPTGYKYTIDFSTFPGVSSGRAVPDWYRVAGPSITILQLLQDICDVLAYEFYVELVNFGGQNRIRVGLIDLSSPPSSFSGIVDAFNGLATDLSYGQELRNEKTKMVLFGEQIHYLSRVNNFDFFFGEDFDEQQNKFVPIIPYKRDSCGFWIKKKIETLNVALNKPFPSNGPYEISEIDIRTAMGSHEMWKNRAFDKQSKGSFNEALRLLWPELVTDWQATLVAGGQALQAAVDHINNPTQAENQSNDNKRVEDLEKIKSFLANLGSTYYGKQFFAKLNQQICWYQDNDEEDREIYYSDIPTGAGGWVDSGPVIGLDDPDLGMFRQDDNRVGCFARFSISGQPTSEDEETTDPNKSPGFSGDDTSPP